MHDNDIVNVQICLDMNSYYDKTKYAKIQCCIQHVIDKITQYIYNKSMTDGLCIMNFQGSCRMLNSCMNRQDENKVRELWISKH